MIVALAISAGVISLIAASFLINVIITQYQLRKRTNQLKQEIQEFGQQVAQWTAELKQNK